jgi:hypothetical protein
MTLETEGQEPFVVTHLVLVHAVGVRGVEQSDAVIEGTLDHTSRLIRRRTTGD